MQIVRVLISSCALAGLLAAQPSLRITSPADEATFHPGESLTVTVEASPPDAFSVILVTGPDPIGYGQLVPGGPPYRFTLQIPEDIPPKKYYLSALGSMKGHAELVNSEPINILIERADSPVSMSVSPIGLDFTMDQKGYLQVMGLFGDGTTADLTQSSRIEYVSSAPWAATVQAQGIVTPVAPGTGKVTVIYGDLKHEVPLRVRESER
jgi:Bacterial Ig-like domain (group 2)